MPTLRLSRPSPRVEALLGALLLTGISGSLFVLVKAGLAYSGPLTIVSLRYTMASLILLPLWWRRGSARRRLKPSLWRRLLVIGLGHFTLGNVANFWGLKFVPATTDSLLSSLMPLVVLLGSVIWLREVPTRVQALGAAITFGGGILFFSPGVEPGEPFGIAIITLGLLGNATLALVGRSLARGPESDTLTASTVPLAVAATVLLPVAVAVEGIPNLPGAAWAILLTLTLLNTVFAYMLYNHVLKTLTAFELSLILNLSPIVTAALSWLLWGEQLVGVEVLGMLAVIAGIALLHYGQRRESSHRHQVEPGRTRGVSP